jgi:hypothetical protein
MLGVNGSLKCLVKCGDNSREGRLNPHGQSQNSLYSRPRRGREMFSRERRSSFIEYIRGEESSRAILYSVVLDDLVPADLNPVARSAFMFLSGASPKSRRYSRMN